MPQARIVLLLLFALATPLAPAAPANTPARASYALDAQAREVSATINNIVNMTIVSKDENDLKAEYRAGFVQGKLQASSLSGLRSPGGLFSRSGKNGRDLSGNQVDFSRN